MVGTTGFEPATSRTPSVRATRLRYVPTAKFRVSPGSKEGQDCAQLVADGAERLPQVGGLGGGRASDAAYGLGFLARQQYGARIEALRVPASAILAALQQGSEPLAVGYQLAQMAARAGDGEPLLVEQAFDDADQVDILLPVEPVALRRFDRLEHGEFGFPEAEDERFRVGEAADVADAEEFFRLGSVLLRVCQHPA